MQSIYRWREKGKKGKGKKLYKKEKDSIRIYKEKNLNIMGEIYKLNF